MHLLFRKRKVYDTDSDLTHTILKAITWDEKAADLKISLFMAACDEYLLKGQLRPKPPKFTNSNNCNQLLITNDTIPGVPLLVHQLRKGQVSEDVVDILSWLIIKLRNPTIITIKPENYENILQCKIFNTPTLMFQLKFKPMSTFELDWERKTQNIEKKLAFSPFKVPQLHGLIYNDLVTNDNYLYLYDNTSDALSQATPSWTWGKSRIGTRVSILALIEYVDSPIVIKMREKHGTGNCYELLRPSMARIKYLMVYVHYKPILPENPPSLLLPTVIYSLQAFVLLCALYVMKR